MYSFVHQFQSISQKMSFRNVGDTGSGPEIVGVQVTLKDGTVIDVPKAAILEIDAGWTRHPIVSDGRFSGTDEPTIMGYYPAVNAEMVIRLRMYPAPRDFMTVTRKMTWLERLSYWWGMRTAKRKIVTDDGPWGG